MNFYDQFIDESYRAILCLPDPEGFSGATFAGPEDYGLVSDAGGIPSPLSFAQLGARISPNTTAAQVYLEANTATAIFTVMGWRAGPGQVNVHQFLNNGQQIANVNTTLVYSATIARTITFPDATGTVALTSDIPSLIGYLQNNVGIAGGTTLIGDTASGGNLTLVSTSNGAKGFTYIGSTTTIAVDEVNKRLGIGTATPTTSLHVVGGGYFSGNATIEGGTLRIGAATAGDLTISGTTLLRNTVAQLQNGIGLAGGQTIIGGTAASENLTLVSTSNATKGKILFGVTGNYVFDGVNNRLGLGIATPAVTLEVRSPAATGDIAYITNSTQALGFIMNVSSGMSMLTTVSGSNPMILGNGSTSSQLFLASSTTGNVGIRVNAPTARVHILAGSATANTAPIKTDSGPLNTTAEVGAWEFLTDKIYFTITTGAARKEIALNDSALTANTFPVATTNGRLVNSSFTTTNLTSSTYTTVLTNVTNITASTGHVSQYERVGNVVTVFGYIDVTPTLAVASEVGISLPVASNFGAVTDCNGLGQADSAIATNMIIEADTGNDRASLKFTSLVVGTPGKIYFSFSYSVI